MASKSIHLREAIQREKNMAAIAALDHHIGEWQVQLSGLQSTRNNLVRIARLPDEILAVIFLFVAAGTHCVTKWARVTWVCRRWRNAALRCPELWSQLNDSTPHPWIDVMVSRSQKALLSVRIDHYHRERSRIPRSKLRKVLKQTDRLQRVFLSCHPDDLPVLFKSLGSPAPRLESVTVKSAVHCLSIPASFNIPPNFLGGSAPKLTELICIGCIPTLDPGTFNFTSLTTLHLEVSALPLQPPINPRLECLPSIYQLQAALSKTPALVNLVIKIPDFSGDPANVATTNIAPRSISLPHLNHFEMESPCHGIAAVISKLQLPASLSLTLRCTDVDEDSVQALSNALNSAWVSLPLSSPHSSPPQLPLEQLDVTQWNRRVLHLGGAAFHSAPGQPNIVASFSISYVIPRDQVGFPGLEGLRMWTPALTRLALAPWPLTQVESLSVSSRTLGLTATGVLKEVLSKPFPSVTSIEAELDAVRQLHDFLSTDPGLPLSTLAVPQTPGSVVSEGQQQGPSFPQLKELTFTKILTLDYEKVIELKDVLLSRAQCGSPLETLHISQCPGFPREVVNAFKTVVPCVLFT